MFSRIACCAANLLLIEFLSRNVCSSKRKKKMKGVIYLPIAKHFSPFSIFFIRPTPFPTCLCLHMHMYVRAPNFYCIVSFVLSSA